MFTFYVVLVVLLCNKKLEKLPKLESSERSVPGVRMGKSGPRWSAISQSDSRILDSGRLRSLKER